MRSLEERLQTLRRGGLAPAVDPAVVDLTRRIQRLRAGRRVEAEEVLDEAGLAQRLGAARPAPGVLLVERMLPLATRHGHWPLAALRAPVRNLQPAGEKWLFLDTETTGLSGGTGNLAFMVGVARLVADGLRLQQYLLTGFSGEAAMLALLVREIGGDTLVTYNGKSFDLPLLTARLRLHGLSDPLATLPHLDLLHPVRRRYSKQWPDCRLATVERRLLGCARQGDLPGAEAPDAWLGFVRHGHWRRLAGVLRHNRLDLLSLAVLVPALEEPERSSGSRPAPPPGRDPGRIQALLQALAAAE